jgi:hypothetical protein
MDNIEMMAANPQSIIGHHRMKLRDAGYHLPNSGLNLWSERLFQSQFLGSVRLQRWRGRRSWAGDSTSCSADRRCPQVHARNASGPTQSHRSKSSCPWFEPKGDRCNHPSKNSGPTCGRNHGRTSAIAQLKHLHGSGRHPVWPVSNDRVARLPVGCDLGLAG